MIHDLVYEEDETIFNLSVLITSAQNKPKIASYKKN